MTRKNVVVLSSPNLVLFFFNDTATTEIYTLSLHDALPISGAFGFSTSRTTKHRAADGRPTPSLSAEEPELAGIACAMKRAGSGVIQVNSDFGSGEFTLLRAAAELAQRPLSLLLVQMAIAPDRWNETLLSLDEACADGLDFTAQVGSRPIGILLGLQASRHPFLTHPLWRPLEAVDHQSRTARIANDR